jgi:FkbM family methyltransferase
MQSGVFVDVGAHIGNFSMRFAELGWAVVAFEPDPDNFSELESNLAEYDKATAVRMAVSDETAEGITFYRSTEFWGIHSLAPFDPTHTDELTVPVTRLDDYLRSTGVGHVEILKVDTEGADKLVLDGFDFDTWRPALVFAEYMDMRSIPHFGYSHHDVAQMMKERGYSVFLADWAPVVQHSRREGGGGPFTFLSCVPYPAPHEPSWGNMIFVPEVDEVRFGEVLHSYLIELNSEIQETLRLNTGLVEGLTRKVGQQQDRIETLNAAVAQRDARRGELDAAISGRNARVTELEEAVAGRDARIERLETAIAGRDSRLSELDEAITRRDARVGELEAAIDGRDARISELDSAILGRDTRIETLVGAVADRDERLAVLAGAVESLDEAIKDRDATRREAVSLRTELNNMRRLAAIASVFAVVLAVATLALALSG